MGMSAKKGGAVQIAGVVAHQGRSGIGPVFTREGVEYGLSPGATGARKLKNCAIEMRAAHDRRAIEIPGLVENQTGGRNDAICTALETIDHGLGPLATARRQLEDGAATAAAGPRAAV